MSSYYDDIEIAFHDLQEALSQAEGYLENRFVSDKDHPTLVKGIQTIQYTKTVLDNLESSPVSAALNLPEAKQPVGGSDA